MVIYGAWDLTAKIQARDLLAQAAAAECGLFPLPDIARHPGGMPYLTDHPSLNFNLSHSGGLALCALDAAPVGVDIQVIKPLRPALPRRVCSPEELDWLEAQPDLWSSFALLWARKESRVKESGQGLTVSIPGIRVPLPSEAPVQLDGLWFRAFTGPNWAAAICGHSQPPQEIIWAKK